MLRYSAIANGKPNFSTVESKSGRRIASDGSNRQALQTELKQIKEQLETIELNLESQLFSWGSLKEPFWQAVRFGGLGVVIGWILKSCAG
jgi:hypothetical protein